MDETTVLSHPVLQRAIRSAQEKIAQQVWHEQCCDSCEEWLRCNLPRPSAQAGDAFEHSWRNFDI